MVLQGKCVETCEKVSIFKPSRTFEATPKPWVAGSNPPAPAITEAKRLRFFSFCCVLFCISLSKAEMTKFFNAFRSKNSFSFSVVSVYSNLSVWYSIKKAAATAEFSFLRSPFYLFTPTQFLMCYKQKSFVMPLSIEVSFFT